MFWAIISSKGDNHRMAQAAAKYKSATKPERARVERVAVSRTYTAAQLGVRCGISTSAVHQKIAAGMSPDQIIAQADQKKAAAAAKATVEYTSNLRGASSNPAKEFVSNKAGPTALALKDSTGKLVTTTEANLRNAIATAEKNELEFRIRSGELAPIGQVRAFMGGCVIRCRDILMGMTDLADRVRQAPDIIAARGLIDSEHRRALTELSNYAKFTSAGQLESIDGGLVGGSATLSKNGKRMGRPPARKTAV